LTCSECGNVVYATVPERVVATPCTRKESCDGFFERSQENDMPARFAKPGERHQPLRA
jgi:hypothetical protein